MKRDQEDAYLVFVTAQASTLRRLGYALTRDWHLADDLTQLALIKLYTAWPRINHQEGNPVAYAKSTLIRTFLDHRRGPARREHLEE
jgi:DNA-directed RNA polymerase specialized sigma24 family protein